MASVEITIADHTIDSPRGRLFAREWTPVIASGTEPILLIHDSLGCVDLWRDFPASLCERSGRRVIAYDRLGWGRSDARTEALPLNFISEESETFLPVIFDHFRIDRFSVFGHSVGGGMAVVCAGKFADSCAAVITESAQAFVDDRIRRGILEAKLAFENGGQFERLKKYHGEKAEWVLRAWTDTWLSPEFASWSLQADLARVKCRLLAIHGDRDEYGSVRHPEVICSLAGGASRKIILPGCGHIPHRETPAAISELVTDFLAQS